MHSRHYIRHDSERPIFFETDIMIGQHPCCLNNIGKGGLSFTVHGPLKPGTHIKVHFPYHDKILSVIGAISWCYGKNNKICHLGVKFEHHVSSSLLNSINRIEQFKREHIKNTDKYITAEDANCKMKTKSF